jgi:hypothetical protein
VFALGQRLRHFADHVTHTAGAANGTRVRQWFQAKKAGWYAVLADPQMPVTSTLLDQAHNAIERKLFAMKGFHHPGGSQQAFLTGLAHLYNLIPYQRRAQHAGQCGVEVEGGRVPTRDWFLNIQILTSGGFRWTVTRSTTKSDGMWKFRIIREEFDRVWGDRKPAWTLAPVPALALEGMLVEIDVIAVVPEWSAGSHDRDAIRTERITTMAVRLNHTIVAARDKDIAAKFLTEILGLPAPSLLGPFAVVQVSDDTSLDYHDADGEITSQHYAFLDLLYLSA